MPNGRCQDIYLAFDSLSLPVVTYRIQIINTITCLIHWHRQSDVDKLFSVRGFNEHMKVKESNNGSLPTRLYEPVWFSSFLDLNVATFVKRKTTM